jgi:cytochrome b6-f complex iron-sulfur subunit
MDSVQGKPVRKNRRDFLKYLLGVGLLGFIASIFYPLLSYLKPPKQGEVAVTSVSAGKLSEFEKDSGKIIRFGNKPVILIRTASGDLRALSAVCTHLECTVQYKKDLGLIWCACHNGKYDLNGRNISGPPPRPLDPYKVIVKGDEIFISKIS